MIHLLAQRRHSPPSSSSVQCPSPPSPCRTVRFPALLTIKSLEPHLRFESSPAEVGARCSHVATSIFFLAHVLRAFLLRVVNSDAALESGLRRHRPCPCLPAHGSSPFSMCISFQSSSCRSACFASFARQAERRRSRLKTKVTEGPEDLSPGHWCGHTCLSLLFPFFLRLTLLRAFLCSFWQTHRAHCVPLREFRRGAQRRVGAHPCLLPLFAYFLCLVGDFHV